MEVKFNLNTRIILILILIVGLLILNFFIWRETVKNKRSVQGIVNYINTQIKNRALPPPETPQQPKEVKKDGK